MFSLLNSATFGNHGCQGGLMDFAYKYIASVKGDDTEKSYPYTAEVNNIESQYSILKNQIFEGK